jgi:hypothetical protein
MLISKIDEYGKMGWIALTLAAFWLAWPIGFAVLAYLYGSGRMQAWRSEVRSPGTWFNFGAGTGAGLGGVKWPGFRASSSGNQAFDDYREATLRGLEEEQQEFQTFLERLRKARDKAEFDAFMAERRQRANANEPIDVSAA